MFPLFFCFWLKNKKKKKEEGEWGINKGKATVVEMKLAARNDEIKKKRRQNK